MPGGGKIIIDSANVELGEAYTREHIGREQHRDQNGRRDAVPYLQPFDTTKTKERARVPGVEGARGAVVISGWPPRSGCLRDRR